MNEKARMSPWTALFIGLSMFGVVVIVAGTVLAMCGMQIVDDKASAIIRFADGVIDELPELIDSLPPAVERLAGRRAPEYVKELSVAVNFVSGCRSGDLCPTVTVTNNGDEVVSLLGIRVAALNSSNVPIRDWTHVVATPLVFDDCSWPGPLLPGQPRHMVLSHWRGLPAEKASQITGVFEISELRIWEPEDTAESNDE